MDRAESGTQVTKLALIGEMAGEEEGAMAEGSQEA